MYKLYRYSEQGPASGLFAGLGIFLHIDPTLLRIAYILMMLFSGHFFICIGMYVVLTLLVPDRENPDQE